MKRKADLHLHTDDSDGTWSNTQLLKQLLNASISTFSITDHDETANCIKMSRTKLPVTMRFIMGVELSTFRNGMRYHILGYQYDPSNRGLNEILQYNKNATEQWFIEIVRFACSRNANICYSDYLDYQNDSSRGGHRAINYLIDQGFLTKASDFFPLSKESKSLPDYPKAEKVVEAIKNSGGFCFIAHPSEYRKGKRMQDDELIEWTKLGIDGIECYHPSATIDDSDAYVSFCERHKLMISGGSDCHGNFLPERQIGTPEIYEEMLNIESLNP